MDECQPDDQCKKLETAGPAAASPSRPDNGSSSPENSSSKGDLDYDASLTSSRVGDLVGGKKSSNDNTPNDNERRTVGTINKQLDWEASCTPAVCGTVKPAPSEQLPATTAQEPRATEGAAASLPTPLEDGKEDKKPSAKPPPGTDLGCAPALSTPLGAQLFHRGALLPGLSACCRVDRELVNDKLRGALCYYEMKDVPEALRADLNNPNWTSSSFLKETFPRPLASNWNRTNRNFKAFPQSLLQECTTVEDRLVILNMWVVALKNDEDRKDMALKIKTHYEEKRYQEILKEKKQKVQQKELSKKKEAEAFDAMTDHTQSRKKRKRAPNEEAVPKSEQEREIAEALSRGDFCVKANLDEFFVVLRDIESIATYLGEQTCKQEPNLPKILHGLETVAAHTKHQQQALIHRFVMRPQPIQASESSGSPTKPEAAAAKPQASVYVGNTNTNENNLLGEDEVLKYQTQNHIDRLIQEIRAKRNKRGPEKSLGAEVLALRIKNAGDEYFTQLHNLKDGSSGRIKLQRGALDQLCRRHHITKQQLETERRRRLEYVNNPKPSINKEQQKKQTSKQRLLERHQAKEAEQAAVSARVQIAVDKYVEARLQAREEQPGGKKLPDRTLIELCEQYKVGRGQILAASRKRLPPVDSEALQEKAAMRERVQGAVDKYFEAVSASESDRLPHGAISDLCESFGITRDQFKFAKKRRLRLQQEKLQQAQKEEHPTDLDRPQQLQEAEETMPQPLAAMEQQQPFAERGERHLPHSHVASVPVQHVATHQFSPYSFQLPSPPTPTSTRQKLSSKPLPRTNHLHKQNTVLNHNPFF